MIKEIMEDEEAKHRRLKDDTIGDGFGSVWSAWCSECGLKTMSIVRPGKVQCNRCRLEG